MIKISLKKKGLTLIEVLISLLILVIIVPPALLMVFSSVKINKNAEDSQKALYIAQQCIEDIKSTNNMDLNSIQREFLKDNFRVVQQVTAEEKYYFPDRDGEAENDDETESESTNIKTLMYDGKIVITKDNDLKNMHIYNASTELASINLQETSNRIEISNGKKENNTIDSSKIILKINDEIVEMDKETLKENCDFIIEMGSMDDEENYNVEIHTINYCNNGQSDFNLYLVKENGSNFDYSFSNDLGKVKFYSNIVKYKQGEPSPQGVSRLYKINVKVWRKEQDIAKEKPLQEIIAYKTALE